MIIYLLTVNITAFILFGLDKHRARRGGRRIPENRLLLAALAGGSLGAIAGMHVFRHKTQHRRFATGLPLVFFLHSCAAIYAYVQLN